MFHLNLPDHSTVPLPDEDAEISIGPGHSVRQKNGVVDLMDAETETRNQTSDHYTEQWGEGVGFLSFIEANPHALAHMPSGQLGWPDLLKRIRVESETRDILVYDAACGYGGIFSQLFAEPPPLRLRYLGADIHKSLSSIKRPNGLPLSKARFIRWDISKPLPIAEKFDYVICRNALMHTPDPKETLRSLIGSLAPGGVIAVSVYARKALLREIIDDALRERITKLPTSEALALARQFTLLGRDLRNSPARITINQDLPFLGIKAGEYPVQAFIYDHIVKCWYNDLFGEKYSDIVNFDWYHPPHAYRFDRSEILALFEQFKLRVVRTDSISAQHYLEATRIA
jgi:SAM-dependent methyltransferase